MQYTVHSNEKDLIQGCKRKDRLAQKYLYQRYYGKMLGICVRYTSQKSEATDVLNQAFLKIFEKIHLYEPSGSFSGWMAKIVFHSAIDYIRRNTLYKEMMDFDAEREVPMEAAVFEQLYAEDLFKVIQQLPATSRTVFSLYVIDGYKHREIAELLNININTSKWQLAQARKQLQLDLKNSNPNNVKVKQ